MIGDLERVKPRIIAFGQKLLPNIPGRSKRLEIGFIEIIKFEPFLIPCELTPISKMEVEVGNLDLLLVNIEKRTTRNRANS
ncbi:MAG: hypothetical protein JO216_08890 [Hyphomicrobiales bacterium]|nr:hypothetical protein [Hyphomicrobiales bacterium]